MVCGMALELALELKFYSLSMITIVNKYLTFKSITILPISKYIHCFHNKVIRRIWTAHSLEVTCKWHVLSQYTFYVINYQIWSLTLSYTRFVVIEISQYWSDWQKINFFS